MHKYCKHYIAKMKPPSTDREKDVAEGTDLSRIPPRRWTGGDVGRDRRVNRDGGDVSSRKK
jgi:hypothetical protein